MAKAGRDIYLKGKQYEYKLMEKLKEAGYYTIRAPGSGRRGKKFFYPDIIAIKKGKILIIEVKAYSDNRDTYIDNNKYNKLKWIANVTGATPLLCVHYKSVHEFRCLELDNYSWNTPRYYAYDYQDILMKGKKIEEL